MVKRWEIGRCELLFVCVADGRRWCIPSGAVDGGNAIRLGGPKYAGFEVDRGEPMPSEVPALDSAI